jgi:hypothetical protein
MQGLSESCWPEIPVSDLALVVAAVRGGTATTARAGRSRHRSEAVFFASILTFLHAAFTGAYPLPSADPGPHEELQMNGMSFAARSAVRFSSALAPVAALSAPGVVSAQDAVEWRVADGGNGHWYEVRVTQTTIAWTDARAQAVALGADLAKAGSSTSVEWLFQRSIATPGAWKPFGSSWLGPWLGGQQQVGASEPNGGWRWVDGSSIDLAATRCAFNNSGGCGVNENRLSFWKSTSAPLSAGTTDYETSDFPDRGYCEPQFPRMTSYIVEWSADCNSDGIVDYGQIRAGELVDVNANNVPDCCEQGFDCRSNAVEWRVADGGNGHWYGALRVGEISSWNDAYAKAVSRGAYLATIASTAESEFIWARIASNPNYWSFQFNFSGPALGGYYSAGSWRWVTGEPWTFTNWGSCYNQQGELQLHYGCDFFANAWNDILATESNIGGAVLEYSADCNSDGIVDYGQIRAGELIDANANNIPDCCEQPVPCTPCQADVDESGAVNSVDLAAVLANWGTDGGKYPRADVNGDGTINSSDLAAVLSEWGPCQ